MNFASFLKSILKKDKTAGLRYTKQNPFHAPKLNIPPRSQLGITKSTKPLDKKRKKVRRLMATRSRKINWRNQ